MDQTGNPPFARDLDHLTAAHSLLRLHIREMSGLPILDVSGELDMTTVPRLKAEISSLVDRGITSLAINLDDVHYLDSTSLGMLVTLHRMLTGRGGQLCLVYECPLVQRIFSITGLDKAFSTFRTDAEAVAYLRG